MAPILAPDTKIPVASALSFLGNHSETAFKAEGKFPASPNPNRKRTPAKPNNELTNACIMVAALQKPIAIIEPKRVPILSSRCPMNRNPIA